jgi:hypothetical protein
VENRSDAELLADLRHGGAAAFDALYGRYRARLFSFLARMTGRRDVAEDSMNLPIHDADEETTRRIRARALHVLQRQARLAAHPALARADRLWSRFLEPALVAASAVLFIGWALARVSGLLPG